MVDVRRAAPEELAAIVAVFGQEPYFQARLDRQAQGRGELLVAWHGGEPVGDVILIREPAPEVEIRTELPDVPQISHLEVAEQHRRRGVASALLDAAEELARGYGHRLVVLGCGLTNPGRPLYDGRGYDDWGHGPVEFRWAEPVPDSEWCHVLIKRLDPSTGEDDLAVPL